MQQKRELERDLRESEGGGEMQVEPLRPRRRSSLTAFVVAHLSAAGAFAAPVTASYSSSSSSSSNATTLPSCPIVLSLQPGKHF